MLGPVRLQLGGPPDAGDRGLTQAHFFRHPAGPPVRGVYDFDCRVMIDTCSTSASVTFRGAAGRGSSTSPFRRFFRNRRRHFPTLGLVTSRA